MLFYRYSDLKKKSGRAFNVTKRGSASNDDNDDDDDENYKKKTSGAIIGRTHTYAAITRSDYAFS